MMKYFLLVLLAICSAFVICNADVLTDDFYTQTCPRVQEIVQTVTRKHVLANPKLPAKLLRLHFHDCFVRGCDGSILLNSTTSSQAEKDARPNLSLSGYDVIEDIKAELEKACPEIVSCADILALAAMESVSIQYGRPLWKVPTGRRDGTISLASETSPTNLPVASANFTSLKNLFASKGLSVRDLVALSGAHTIGVGRCSLIRNRLYNFTGNGDQDPSLDPAYADFLKTKCSNDPTDRTTTVEMDPESSLSFDNHYYVILKQNKGLFPSDASLLTDVEANNFVQKSLEPQDHFFKEFAGSMRKMGAIEVLTGYQGQIRKQCTLVN